MYIDEAALLQYVTAQQLAQMKAMNPNVVKMSYDTALGYLQSEIGYIYNLPLMLANTGDDRDLTLMWLLTVLTCRNIMGASIQISDTLMQQYEDAVLKIRTLKAGYSKMLDAPAAEEINANITLVNNDCNYLG